MTRIRGLKPTRKQCDVLKRNNMNTEDWLIKTANNEWLVCIHRISGRTKIAHVQAVLI